MYHGLLNEMLVIVPFYPQNLLMVPPKRSCKLCFRAIFSIKSSGVPPCIDSKITMSHKVSFSNLTITKTSETTISGL